MAVVAGPGLDLAVVAFDLVAAAFALVPGLAVGAFVPGLFAVAAFVAGLAVAAVADLRCPVFHAPGAVAGHPVVSSAGLFPYRDACGSFFQDSLS